MRNQPPAYTGNCSESSNLKWVVGLWDAVRALLAAFGAVSAFLGGQRRDARYVSWAQRAGLGVLALVALAFLTMESALITHDFSVSYVAQVGSRATPLFYTIISAWSALEGSILLWALILSIYTALLVLWTRRQSDPAVGVDPYLPYALGTVFCVNIFFLLLISWPANPFRP